MKMQLALLLVVVLLASLPSVVLARLPLPPEIVLDATREAKRYSGTWFAFGFSYGGIGVLLAYLTPSSPDPERIAARIAGKPPSYVDDYVHIYKDVARKQKLKSSIIGCSIWAAGALYLLTR